MAVGVSEEVIQKLEIGLISTVGGCFTMIVLVVNWVPHAFVAFNFKTYVPGVTKLKEGFDEFRFVPFVKLQTSEPIPQ